MLETFAGSIECSQPEGKEQDKKEANMRQVKRDGSQHIKLGQGSDWAWK